MLEKQMTLPQMAIQVCEILGIKGIVDHIHMFIEMIS